MMKLVVRSPGNNRNRSIALVNTITTIGSDPENDLHIDSLEIAAYHAQVIRIDNEFRIQSASRRNRLTVNGEQTRDHILSEGDVLGIGDCKLIFTSESVAAPKPPMVKGPGGGNTIALGFQELLKFSEELMTISRLDELLDRLLARIVQSTNAAKGFIVLMDEDGESRREVAKNIPEQEMHSEGMSVSDSIIQKVIKNREAIVVSDAFHDNEFSSSASVVNLRLCSVMCCPLIARGEFLGIIYLGNDNVVNLFSDHSLSLLKAFAGQASLILRNALLLNELQDTNEHLRDQLENLKFGNIIGSCPSMMDIYRKIEKVSTTDISVLIEGETGTGKELIAHEVHARSNRAKGPFIVINCGAIPENLLESELFGHVRGAFTGAVTTKNGKFQAANGGTLFLDELGEMPLQLQVKLLRALQERKVSKLGDTRLEKVDIRVVAATNKTLSEEVKAGRFREDLFYRLNVVALSLPPLRDRGGDIELIARYFLQRYAGEFQSQVKDFTKGCLNAMRKHKWSGNIRELENRVKKAVVFAEGDRIDVSDMDLEDGLVHKTQPLAEAKEDFQRRYIDKILRMNDGNRTKTARDLGVDPRTIFRHLEKKKDEGVPEKTIGALLD